MYVREQSTQIARGYTHYAHDHHKFLMKPGNVQILTIYYKLIDSLCVTLKGKLNFLLASDVACNFKAIRCSFAFPLW